MWLDLFWRLWAKVGERRSRCRSTSTTSSIFFPLVHVIMALVAIPFALVSPRSGGRAMGIEVAIVIAAGYWVVHSVAIAFAQADLLPAALAAWTADIVFAGIGTALFLSART